MKLFDHQRKGLDLEISKKIALHCADIAKRYDTAVRRRILSLLHLSKSLGFEPYSFDKNSDYENYLTAIRHGNILAIELFTRIGNDPFDPDSPFSGRLRVGKDSIANVVERLKEVISSPQLTAVTSKDLEQLQSMVELMNSRFEDLEDSKFRVWFTPMSRL